MAEEAKDATAVASLASSAMAATLGSSSGPPEGHGASGAASVELQFPFDDAWGARGAVKARQSRVSAK